MPSFHPREPSLQAASRAAQFLQGAPPQTMPHLAMLDGWRGVSILLVLAAHLVPLSPKEWGFNYSAGLLGMSFFFTLSGFLITGTILYEPSIRVFLIRRLFRILPLAWLYLFIVLPTIHAAWRFYPASLLFYANLPPFYLQAATGHLWSICVEVHFYIFIAAFCMFGGRRCFYLLPFFALAITAARIWLHQPASIVSWLRADEILAGATLLLVTENKLGTWLPRLLRKIPFAVWLIFTLASCLEQGGGLQYVRPYLSMCLLGSILLQPDSVAARRLQTRWLAYLAGISYSLYIIHGLLHLPWFDGPTNTMRRFKRPLGLILVWALAHVSSTHYENRWVRLGKRWSRHVLLQSKLKKERPLTAAS